MTRRRTRTKSGRSRSGGKAAGPRTAGAGFLARPAFLGFVLLFFFATHLYRLTDPPNGDHRGHETETVAVARNFAMESWDILRPRVDGRGTTDGVVGMDFPLYSWSIGAASTLGWDIHGWGRLLAVLGGCAALFGFHRVVRSFTGQADLAGLATFVAASAPLLAFYGRMLQPEGWGLAFAMNGLALFVRWASGGHPLFGAGAAVLTAVGGVIEPTVLAFGLPMLVLLVGRHRLSFLKEPRWWIFATACLVPVALWVRHARGLVRDLENAPVYLGAHWEPIGRAIGSGDFYASIFRPWGFELVIGAPVLWAFVMGLGRLRALPNAGFLVAWIGGGFATYLLTAQCCAGPHDYYAVTAVFPLAVVTALGLRIALTSPRRWARVLAIVVAVSMPFYGFARMSTRFGEPYDFWAGRARASLHLPADSLIVTLERTPCFLLYYSGRKGWPIGPGEDVAAIRAAARAGARYLLVENGQRHDLTPYRDVLGPELYRDDWLTAYPIRTGPTLSDRS